MRQLQTRFQVLTPRLQQLARGRAAPTEYRRWPRRPAASRASGATVSGLRESLAAEDGSGGQQGVQAWCNRRSPGPLPCRTHRRGSHRRSFTMVSVQEGRSRRIWGARHWPAGGRRRLAPEPASCCLVASSALLFPRPVRLQDFYGWTVDKLAELSTKFLQPEELRLIFDMPAYCQRKELVAALNATICVGAELCVFEYSRHSDSWQWRDCSVVETRKPE